MHNMTRFSGLLVALFSVFFLTACEVHPVTHSLRTNVTKQGNAARHLVWQAPQEQQAKTVQPRPKARATKRYVASSSGYHCNSYVNRCHCDKTKPGECEQMEAEICQSSSDPSRTVRCPKSKIYANLCFCIMRDGIAGNPFVRAPR